MISVSIVFSGGIAGVGSYEGAAAGGSHRGAAKAKGRTSWKVRSFAGCCWRSPERISGELPGEPCRRSMMRVSVLQVVVTMVTLVRGREGGDERGKDRVQVPGAEIESDRA